MTPEELVKKGFIKKQYTEQPRQPVMYTYETTDQSQIAILLYALDETFNMEPNQSYKASIEIMEDQSIMQYLICNQQDSLEYTHDQLEKDEFEAVVNLMHALKNMNHSRNLHLDYSRLYPRSTVLINQNKVDVWNNQQKQEKIEKLKAEIQQLKKDKTDAELVIHDIESVLTDLEGESDFSNFVEDRINTYSFRNNVNV